MKKKTKKKSSIDFSALFVPAEGVVTRSAKTPSPATKSNVPIQPSQSAPDPSIKSAQTSSNANGLAGMGGVAPDLKDSLEALQKFKNMLDNMGIDSSFAGSLVADAKPDPKKEKIIIFFGFNGKLASKYCVVEGVYEEVKTRMSAISEMVKIPWSMYHAEEEGRTEKMQKNATEITFDEALNEIRKGSYEEYHEENAKKNEIAKFEEGEVDEFDENCVIGCTPGDHRCGKKNI